MCFNLNIMEITLHTFHYHNTFIIHYYYILDFTDHCEFYQLWIWKSGDVFTWSMIVPTRERYLLLIFKNFKEKKLCKGGSDALVSTRLLSTQQLAKRLLCSRFVNTRGQRGKNIPATLHNEHLNKACKTVLGHLGPNTYYTSHLSCFFKIPWNFST